MIQRLRAIPSREPYYLYYLMITQPLWKKYFTRTFLLYIKDTFSSSFTKLWIQLYCVYINFLIFEEKIVIHCLWNVFWILKIHISEPFNWFMYNSVTSINIHLHQCITYMNRQFDTSKNQLCESIAFTRRSDFFLF